METKIIGIDNGYGFTKTAHTSFATSLKQYLTAKPALMDNVVEYKGQFYGIGGDRLKVRSDKTVDNLTYIITLAGIAEELKRVHLQEAEVILAVGLPLERCGVGKDAFIEYFKQDGDIHFSYEEKEYHVVIKDVLVFPQGYAAIVEDINSHRIADNTVLVDIGSWTIDILPINNGRPDINHCLSLNDGVINCMLSANEEVRKNFGSEVLESQIQSLMMGNKNVLPAKYEDLIARKIRDYIENVAATLREYKFNIDTLSFIFVGGGACIVKNFGVDLFPSARVETDIHINAIGYECLAKTYYANRK